MKEHQIVHAGVGRKFQNPSVFEDLTVFENLEVSYPQGHTVMGALAFKRDAAGVEAVESIAETIFLSDQLNEPAGLLSHGQKQWLEIGMLLGQEPQLLLIDEPAAGMTDEETMKTAELFKRLAQKHSLMVVEHDMDFIEALDCKVTVLHEGHVLAEGSLATVKANPQVIEVYLGR